MPELPDIEIDRLYLDQTSLNKRIQQVEVESSEVLDDISSEDLQKRLIGRAFKQSQRHGKYLLVNLDDGACLAIHFGMTGELIYQHGQDKQSTFARVLIDFEDGDRLIYDDRRMIGHIGIANSVDDLISEKNLGMDVLMPEFDFETFIDVLPKKGTIKTILVDQHRMAGIGNVYADEILFQARIAPHAKVNDLNDTALKTIFDQIKKVMQAAIELNAERKKFPHSYLMTHRQAHSKCPRCEGAIQEGKISGRQTFWCPACQVEESR